MNNRQLERNEKEKRGERDGEQVVGVTLITCIKMEALRKKITRAEEKRK